MRKLLIISFAFLWQVGFCQVTKPPTISLPCWCGMHRYDEDTSKWILYKISDIKQIKKYFYFANVSYGMIGKDGWTDLVNYNETLYQQKNYLLKGCQIKDTIPEVMTVGSYDEEKKLFKYCDEYRVGGFMGKLVRTGQPYYSKK